MNCLDHRKLLYPSLLIVLVFLLAACGAQPIVQETGEGDTTAAGTSAEAGSTAADESGEAGRADEQVLRVAMSNIEHMSPHLSQAEERMFLSSIFLPPFRLNAFAEIQPALATGVDVSEDGLVYTLHIDPDAVWSDGSPVTADQVKASWEYGTSPAATRGSQYRDILGKVKGFEAVLEGTAEEMEGLVVVDDKTLQIELTEPDSLLATFSLAHPKLGVVKMEDVLADEQGWWLNDPATNGPYKIGNWDSATGNFELVPNPNWWGEPPVLQKIEFVKVEDQQIIELMWQNDEVDYAQLPFGGNIESVIALDPEAVYEPPQGAKLRQGTVFYNFFVANEPMQDIHLRKALIHAVDWDKLVEVAWGGQQERRVGPLPPHIECNMYDEPGYAYEFDPELAQEELAASEYGSADNVPRITIMTWTSSPEVNKATQIMVEYWRDNLGLTNVEIVEEYGTEDWKDQIQILRISGAGPPDAARYLLEGISSQGYLCASYHQGCADDTEFSPQILSLLQEADRLDRDDPRYCELVKEAQWLWHDAYWQAPLYIIKVPVQLVKPWVENFEMSFYQDIYTLDKIYIADH